MKLLQFLMPRLEYILFAAVFWGIASTGPILLNSDGDLPRHLLVGQLIRETQTVHQTDIFSFRTVGYPSIPHEWLSQVIFSIFHDLLGLGGVVLLTALLVTATWWLIFHQALARSNSLLASVLFTALGIGASLIHVLPRPHLFSYLLITLWILVLEQIQIGKTSRWWLLPVLMLAWVNLHGMFVLGIVIWVIYVVGGYFENQTNDFFLSTKTKAMLAGGALSLGATFLSPSGFQIWGAIASLGGNAYIKSRIPEYQSANFHMPETWPFVLILMLVIISFARTQPGKWTDALLITAFAGVALYASRMLPLFAIVAAPSAAQTFAKWLKQDFASHRIHSLEKNITAINQTSNGVLWVVLVFLAVVLLFKTHTPIDPGNRGNNFDPKFFPVEALTWLETHPQSGHLFNEFDWGGYILLKSWSRYPIFMDGHTHIYGEALTREYEQVITVSADWQSVMDKYQIAWALLRQKTPIANELQLAGWQILYQDDTAIILKNESSR